MSDFGQAHAASRRRLEDLAGRLSDQDLARATPYGWTVAALLAHLAFWDQRVLALVRRWQAAGRVDASPIDAAAVNDALRPLCLALDPRAAVALCLASAAEVDAALAALPAGQIAAIEAELQANPFQFRFNRALHRQDHLADIERLLAPAGA